MKKASRGARRNPADMRHLDAAFGSWRTRAILAVLILLAGSLIWHLAHLQVIPGKERGFDFLQKQGQARSLRSEKINAYRGIITDRNGEILAVSTPVKSIFVNPQRLDFDRVAELAEAVDMGLEALQSRLSRYADKQFMYIKRHMPPQDASQVLALAIPGVYAEEEYQRYYPAGEVVAHIVGFTNLDEHGQEGMELALNEWLAGTPGMKRVVKDQKGNVVRDLGVMRAAASGKDVQLSIDLRLQYLAYRELKAAVAAQQAASGSIVILDVHTGEILAMANQPSYNPNNRSQVSPEQMRNRAVTDLFEPGSTMKPFTILAALESGRYTVDSEINTNPGYFRVANKTYTDIRNYGMMNLTAIITKSSQVGVSKIAMDLDPNVVRDTFYRVGFGQGTGIGYPGEAIGYLPDRAKWYPTERAAMAFGHGLNVTTLQLAQAYNVLASGGLFRGASLLKLTEETSAERVIEQKHAVDIVKMLKTVTEKGGTATRAHLDSYTTAGKTGTTHKVTSHGYAYDKYVAFFAGMAPAENPDIVVVVVIDEPPADHYYGGEAAAPVFASVVESALRLRNVAPSGQQVAAKP